MDTIIINFESISPDKREYIKNIPSHLHSSGQQGRLIQLLTNLSYLHEFTRLFEIYSLLKDYNLICPDLHETTTPYRDFIQKHVQRLMKYRGTLLTLLYHEGFHGIQQEIEELAANPNWQQAWLKTTPAWMPPPTISKLSPNINIYKSYSHAQSIASALAIEQNIAFYVKNLGEIRIVDLQTMYEQPTFISTRRLRLLNMIASRDGKWLALAYEGEAELFYMKYDAENRFTAAETVNIFNYRLPEFEKPIMAFDENSLWYQGETGYIEQLVLGKLGQIESRKSFDDSQAYSHYTEGELSGLALFKDETIASFRYQNSTRVIKIADRPLLILDIPKADVACVEHNDGSLIAISFTNREIIILDTKNGNVADKISVNELPSSMIFLGRQLLWVSVMGTLHLWSTTRNALQQIHDNEQGFLEAHSMDSTSGDEFTLSSSTGVYVCSIDAGNNNQGYPILATLNTQNGYYMIQDRQQELWLIDEGARIVKRLINDAADNRLRVCDIDGRKNVLVASLYGRSLVFNLENPDNLSEIDLPANIVGIAGDAETGFWLTDGNGTIFWMNRYGNWLRIHDADMTGVGRSSIYCFQDIVIWSGVIIDDVGQGSENLDIVMFYRSSGTANKKLELIGKRVFEVADGLFQTLTYDASSHRLWMIWQNGNKFNHSIKYGAITEFINRREAEQELRGIDLNVTDIVKVEDPTAFFLLCESGNLFVVNEDYSEVIAVLPASKRITDLSEGTDSTNRVLFVADSKEPYFGELRGYEGDD